jgi:hypothetical protein
LNVHANLYRGFFAGAYVSPFARLFASFFILKQKIKHPDINKQGYWVNKKSPKRGFFDRKIDLNRTSGCLLLVLFIAKNTRK